MESQEATRTLRVMIADDDPDIRELLQTVIEREPNLELAGAANDGEEAVKVAAEVQPDVAILDWAMPGGGGDRAAASLTANDPDLRVIGISAMGAHEASYVMQTAGAVAFLSKPFTKDQLVEAIQSAARW